jgi:hypothetical protein
MTIQLVRAGSYDVAAILAFQQEAASKTYHPMSLSAIEASIRDDETRLVIRDADAMTVGFLIYKKDEDKVVLDQIVIGSPYRNKDYGSKALKMLLTQVPRQMVELTTHPGNQAVPLFARHGSRWAANLANCDIDGQPRVLMRRKAGT